MLLIPVLVPHGISMSIPHTGRLVAEIKGVRCEFDGDHWAGPDAALNVLLNEATESTVKHHHSIEEIARRVLRETGLEASARILSVKPDRWRTELPPDAVD